METVINVRTKKTVKLKASKIFKREGFTMSSAINTFLTEIIITNKFPFTPSL